MLKKPVVLLVDDEAILVIGVEDALISAGFEVFSALNAQAAMAEIDSDPEKFACLVTDIRLGGDIDGWQVARHARSRHPRIAVVYMTGHAAPQWSSEGVKDSVLLAKPFPDSHLAATLLQLMNQSEPLTAFQAVASGQ
ncbi:MAG: response regulator [Candidatus Devosia phytovorans]|uniref:Response regulator n=1 Tax=Candidatus Devosia phytovorans TaxID=3121372 RepID=A0AAJ6B179_9HYPH|nr:response regulator [Devosia sp.]WEK05481.1 MAG: response regulator [Devosia sp.]